MRQEEVEKEKDGEEELSRTVSASASWTRSWR